MKTKILSLLLAFALIVSVLPIGTMPALAAPAEAQEETVTYPVPGGSILFDPATGVVTGYEGEIAEVEIPGEIDGIPVVIIGTDAFNECATLTSITIPDSVTTIREDAFCFCYNLTTVTLPVSVTTISDYVFYGSENLTDIYYGGSRAQWDELRAILYTYDATIHYNEAEYFVPGGSIYFDPETGTVTGYAGEITELNIPSEIDGIPIVAIGEYAFFYCDSLTSVTIPDSVETICNHAFTNCESLTTVSIPDSVTTIGDSAFCYCTSLTDIAIPDSVTIIGDGAFFGCCLSYITLPDSVVSIGSGAFSDCNLLEGFWVDKNNPNYCNDENGILFSKDKTELVVYPGALIGEYTIPDSVTTIGENAFGACYNLTAITIPDSVETICKHAFTNCESLTNVIIPDSVTTIDEYAFFQCYGLTSIAIPDSITFIGDCLFYDCNNLTDLYYSGSYDQWIMIDMDTDYNDFGGSYGPRVHYNSSMPSLYPVPGGSLHFNPKTGAVTGYEGEITEVEIPDEIDGIPVVAINENAFECCYSLTSITFPDSLTTIGEYAFALCENLTDVIIPDGVTSIGDGAFQNCYGLSELTIPGSVSYIGAVSFLSCGSLTNVTIPEGVKTIGAMAFESCYELASIGIPASVTTIGFDAFYDCYNLTDIYYGGSEAQWDAIEKSDNDFSSINILYGTKLEFVPYVVPGGSIIFNPAIGTVTGFEGEPTEIVIPSEIEGVPVVAIGAYAFYNCDSLTSITFPDSLETIGGCAFEDCDGLSLLTIPNGVTTIESYAFYWCWGLKYVEIPASVTFIGENAFYDCQVLTDIYYGGSEEQWYEIEQSYNDFSGAEIHFIATMPAPYPVPGGGIYFDSETGTVTDYVGNISELNIPAEIDGVPVVAIGDNAFEYCCSLTSITFPDSLKTIGARAFLGCDVLSLLTIPNGVTTIDYDAFRSCSSLKNVEIPASVTTIGYGAFCSCYELTDIYYTGSEEQWHEIDMGYDVITGEGAFDGGEIHFNSTMPELVFYPVPGGGIYFDPATGTITDFDGEIVELNIPSEIDGVPVVAIGDYAFEYCYNLTSITFPDSLTTIGGYSFVFCESLTSIIIPDGVTAIGDGAFQNCYSLSDVTIPGSVTYIGAISFLNCGSLTHFTIPDGVATIGAMAFDSCYSLTSIEIPASVTTIGFDAFYDCYNLTDIYYGGSEAQWDAIEKSDNDFSSINILYGTEFEVVSYPVPGGSILFDPATGTITGYEGSPSEIDIPSEINGVPVVAIDAYALNCSLDRLAIPISVTRIGTLAFTSDLVKYLYYSGSIEQWNQIEKGSFDYDPYNPFDDIIRYYMNAVMPKAYPVTGGNIYIDPLSGIVRDCDSTVTEANIPASIDGTKVVAIDERAFYYHNNLTSVAIADGVTTLGESVFEGCSNLTDITIPDSVTEIGESTFEGCSSLVSITIPDGVTTISENTFLGCESLTNVTIPDSVTTIGKYAFGYCENLTNIIIPNRVTTIGEYAFEGCYTLTSITIPDGITCIDNFTFYGCYELTNISIPASVTTIGDAAFGYCYNLTSITFPDGVTTLGNWIFENCNNLTSVTIPDSVTSIGDYIFAKCENLPEIHYSGSEAQWAAIEKGENDFGDATIHFNPTESAPCTHNYKPIETAPTCTDAGYTTYTCTLCADTYVDDYQEALGHDVVNHKAQAPTCTEIGWDAYETCSHCDYSTYKEIAALGHDKVSHKAQAPTCTDAGWDAYETCSRCDYSTYTEKAALGHDKVSHKAQTPTCTDVGWDAYETCSRCDYSTYAEKAALGHDKVSHKAQAPTCTDAGWDAYETCSRCDYTTYQERPTLEHEFKGGKCVHCGAVDSGYEKPGHVCPSAAFTDIPAYGNWAHNGIDYCVEQELMNGVGNNLFNPNGTVSRAQLVTILYRVAGSPETEFKGTFTDVANGKWYSNAIEWAAANGVVNGVGDGKFAPDQSITREQIATILYRYHGSPAVSGNLNSFPDAGSVGSFARNGLLWATQNELINGVSSGGVTTLAPKDNATRAQIAAIIMRYREAD